MSLFYLDTDYLISFAEKFHENHERASTEMKEWLLEGHDLAASSISWQEFYRGKTKPRPPEITAPTKAILTKGIVPFGEEHAERAAELFYQIGRLKRLQQDCAIAATAIIENGELATFNVQDFKRFASFGLRIVGFNPSANQIERKNALAERNVAL